jgi:hypothetical protein
MAKSRLIVLASNIEWRVLHMHGARCGELRTFTVNTENQALLLAYLRQYPKATIYFLTDLADEHYHVESMPRVKGAAKKQLLARRLAAWPFAQELHAVNKISSMPNRTREEHYLFSAIHYPPLRGWLQALQQEGKRVNGVYTQALCLPCWISMLLQSSAPCLYIHNDKQQLRICYLYQSKLVFSRQLAMSHDADIGARVINEVAQTRQYLINQGWLQEDELLELIWVDGGHTTITLAKDQLPANVSLVYLSPEELVHASGCLSVPAGLSASDWIAIQVMLRARQLPNLAPETSLLNHRILQVQRHIRWMSVLTICLCSVSGWCNYQAIQHTQFKIQQTKTNLALWQAALPELGVAEADLARVQTLSQTVQGLEKAARLPNRSLKVVQNAMVGVSSWQLKKVEWTYGKAGMAVKESQSSSNVWSEIITVSLSRNQTSNDLEARQAWQKLLERLRIHPDVAGLSEVQLTSASENLGKHGDTRQVSESVDKHILEIRLRNLQKGTAE